MKLSTPIQSLPFVGPTYAQRLQKLSIQSIEDLLYHLPHRYDDFRSISKIASLKLGEIATIKAQIISAKNIYTRKGSRIQKALLADSSGQIEATWFNQPFITSALKPGSEAFFSGKADMFGSKPTLTAPEYELIRSSIHQPIHTARLVPVYPETSGVSSKWLRSRIAPLLSQKNLLVDWLPPSIISQHRLDSLATALKQIHFPSSLKLADSARKRLSFDELFLLQLASQIRKNLWQKQQLSHQFTAFPSPINQFIKSLPFSLTSDQKTVTNEILADLTQPKAMNRLLYGDVGSGKTVVAAIAIYLAYLNGFKSALMAPTEILALQHEKTISQLLEPLGVKISTHTSSRKTSTVKNLKSNHLFIGTHALLHRNIPSNLGLLVIDEQHRFGVKQRSQLLKAKKTPHLLSMTATPIPRTVALTLYGELDISVINQLPPGRKQVKTWVVPPLKRSNAYDWIKKQIKAKKIQVFVVCPFIQESEAEKLTQVKAAEVEYQNLKRNIYPHLRVGLLHGKMRAKDKQAIIKKFRNHKLDILVSTPVIEVGIDIPNAAIILIEGSDRFGLAQLHQLRGRVGRGSKSSFCLLFTSTPKSTSLKRLKALETQRSGFELAELDLKLRGPGEIHGTNQHGFTQLKIAQFSDQHLITITHTQATKLIKSDPHLKKHPLLSQKLKTLLEKQIQPN